jgi:hypothetical protein
MNNMTDLTGLHGNRVELGVRHLQVGRLRSRTAKGKARLQLEWLGRVRREGFSQALDLLSHILERVVGRKLFQQPHRAHKVIPGIAVDGRIGSSNGSLKVSLVTKA